MKTLLFFIQNPGNGSGHPACPTPNPPWWCTDNPPDASIDTMLWLLIPIGLALGIYIIDKYKEK